MKVICRDMQEPHSAVDGIELSRPSEVPGLFAQLRGRQPFVFELVAENGYMLSVGYGDDNGSIQFSRTDGEPPYLMAVAEDASETEGVAEFLVGGTPTPIPRRFCMPRSKVEDIVATFVRDGTKSNIVSWEEI